MRLTRWLSNSLMAAGRSAPARNWIQPTLSFLFKGFGSDSTKWVYSGILEQI